MRKVISILLSSLLLITTSAASAEVSQEDFGKAMNKYLSSTEGQDTIGAAMEKFIGRKQQEMQKARKAQEKKTVEEQFNNPAKITLSPDDSFKGPKNAPVTVVEFSDFQCPFCKRGADVMDEVAKAYPKEVKVVFKHLPLSFHQKAEGAALAAIAAGKQGKFWEMHDALFNNQKKLGESFYLETAEKIGLKVPQFKDDMASEASKKQLKNDMATAGKLGIRGTPGFLVNGVKVSGARPFGDFKKIIDRWLEKK